MLTSELDTMAQFIEVYGHDKYQRLMEVASTFIPDERLMEQFSLALLKQYEKIGLVITDFDRVMVLLGIFVQGGELALEEPLLRLSLEEYVPQCRKVLVEMSNQTGEAKRSIQGYLLAIFNQVDNISNYSNEQGFFPNSILLNFQNIQELMTNLVKAHPHLLETFSEQIQSFQLSTDILIHWMTEMRAENSD